MNRVVFIDAGHGGSNTGVVANGIEEKWLTLELALSMEPLLNDSSWDVIPILSRHDDSEVSLSTRGKIANRWKSALAITIHVNSLYGIAADGVRAFHKTGDKVGQLMANTFAENVPDCLKQRRNAVHHVGISDGPPYNVLKYYECPAALFEIGFASDQRDAQRLRDPIVRSGLITAMLQAIQDGLVSGK